MSISAYAQLRTVTDRVAELWDILVADYIGHNYIAGGRAVGRTRRCGAAGTTMHPCTHAQMDVHTRARTHIVWQPVCFDTLSVGMPDELDVWEYGRHSV